MSLQKESGDLVAYNLDIILVFIIGASVGSFLALVAVRFPHNIDIISLPSRCDSCGIKLRAYELIPIVSYLLLRRKCKSCKQPIKYSFFLTELLTATTFIALYLLYGFELFSFKMAILFCVLIVLSLIDLEIKAVPDTLLMSAILIALVPIDADFIELFSNFLIFCGGFFILDFVVTYYIQHIKYALTKNEDLVHQKALGEGDIPVAGIIGATLGIKFGLIAIFCAALFAFIPSLYYLIVKKEIELPFIPFLALGLLSVFCVKGIL